MKYPPGQLTPFLSAGFPVRGTVWVGANDGEEIPYLLKLGLTPVLAFEPHPVAFNRLDFCWGEHARCINLALGNTNGELELHVPDNNDDRMATGLNPIPGDEHLWTRLLMQDAAVTVPMSRFDTWADNLDFNLAPYNALVIDVQGMELDVLEGFGIDLYGFDYLCVELSSEPLYEGEAPGQAVADWLDDRGYSRISPIVSHNDVLFVQRREAKG